HLDNAHSHESEDNGVKHRMRKRLGNGDVQTDVIAAALVGAAVGIAATLLLRPKPRLGNVARDTATRAANRARKRSEAWLESLPDGDEIKEKLAEYVETAREAIDRTVEGELRSLRKRLRRSRIGV